MASPDLEVQSPAIFRHDTSRNPYVTSEKVIFAATSGEYIEINRYICPRRLPFCKGRLYLTAIHILVQTIIK